MDRNIAVAMSGGVDSSAAAWLLQQEGHSLIGITMKLFQADCAAVPDKSPDPVQDAREVAQRLGIPHYVCDFSQPFRTQVMDRFAAGYQRGETPNPCIDCNRYLKFGALLQRAQELGQESVATGHYVRLEQDAGSGRWLLKKALHPEKDQSYVLYRLTQEQLSHSCFPLGNLAKEEIREIARRQGLVTARKKDSQDICFVPDGDYAAFLRRYTGLEFPHGPFLDEAGRVLGEHQGIICYTVGQRRGLGVSSNQGRLYVKQVRTADNSVILSQNDALYRREVHGNQLNLIAASSLEQPTRLRARIRYRQQEQPCIAQQIGPDRLLVTFDQPQRAVTPGQAVVLYDGDTVVGGATILGDQEESL